MRPAFVDTSGVLALLNRKDEAHERAARGFASLRAERATLLSTSFVLVETYALVGRRLGIEAVGSFRAEFEPLLDIVWVDRTLHDAGLDLLLEEGRQRLSLVDAVSFVAMRRRGVERAFSFDRHFEQAGFALV